MSSASKVFAALIGLAALGSAGYMITGKLSCEGYEEDYLNALAGVRSSDATMSVLDTPEVQAMMEQGKKRYWQDAERALAALIDECGSRAMNTAHRKGQNVLMGLPPD